MEKLKTPSRKVGVYDRPASADRARYIRAVVYVIAIALGVIGLVAFLMSQANGRSAVTNARTAEMRDFPTPLTHDKQRPVATSTQVHYRGVKFSTTALPRSRNDGAQSRADV